MNKLILIALLTGSLNYTISQNPGKLLYEHAYDSLKMLIDSNTKQSFKKAVFLVEHTYANNGFNYEEFNPLKEYPYADSVNFAINMAIYHVLKDTVTLEVSSTEKYKTKPYTYDFNDFFGYQDWRNMFVTKLLATHKGNCHSLPYLYKILADELGATCWLSLAPNHIYIKNRCKKTGWYNTELTSGEFPIDAWITTSGYIPVKAVQTGIYMDTLSNRQAIALCVLDLAKGYAFQTGNYDDGFILNCCDLVLQYHPVNVQAMLLKAETLKQVYEKQKLDNRIKAAATYDEMTQLYITMFDLGYREMPAKMYMQWLRSVTEQRGKYGNKQIKETGKGRTK
jgi:hypothetical protein